MGPGGVPVAFIVSWPERSVVTLCRRPSRARLADLVSESRLRLRRRDGARAARFSGSRRVGGVRVPSSPGWGWLTATAQAVPYVSLPKAGWILIVPVVVGGFVRILMEWQLRRTLREIFQRAPGGSVVVIQKRGLGGSMWVRVGSGPTPGSWPGRAELR